MTFSTQTAVILTALALLAGCDHAKVRDSLKLQPSISVFVDPENGCEYLTRQGAITPRLHTDGVQVCRGEDKLGNQVDDSAQSYYFDEHGEDPTGDYDAARNVITPAPLVPVAFDVRFLL